MTTYDVLRNLVIKAISAYDSYEILPFDYSTIFGFRVRPIKSDGFLSCSVLHSLQEMCELIGSDYYIYINDNRPTFVISFDK